MARDGEGVRRRIAFDNETYLALDRLAKDRMQTIQELAEVLLDGEEVRHDD